MNAALAEAQARQAVTVAAWLRYPTATDAALVAMAGPGGSARLDWLLGGDPREVAESDYAWRTWVDEVVASWAASLLTSPALANAAVAALAGCEHAAASAVDFRRLTTPDEYDRRATPLLRHPDLMAPVIDLHRRQLLERLHSDHPVGAV
ncbi:hypothetical protein SSPO_080020 [Streptomyces antimycoticus]|uniref:Uncharacterized protein n=1 Tax=Streptomyces antimycoticus TaxID=68175 RepID=A0A499UTN4_9ACTN|nr:hypothetical protein SSPO_080020 [Streptomyces antimycoticus]